MTPEQMSEMDEPTLGKALTEEICALHESGAGMPFIFDPLEAFTLLSLLQTVLRHPSLSGYPRDFGLKLAQEIEQRISVAPAIRETARRGWLKEYDHAERA
jgi:hypothetical protein